MFSEQVNHGGCKVHDPKYEYVTKKSFIENMTTIFIGSLDQKIKFTFRMYDFRGYGKVSPEDMRLMLSYLPLGKKLALND